MAYTIDPVNGDIIIGGFQNGIASDPYSGFVDMNSLNITSVPGEAMVGFQGTSVTQAPSYPQSSGVLATAFGDGLSVTLTGLTANTFIENGQAVSFTAGITGLGTGTTVYVVAAQRVSGTSEIIGFTTTYGGTQATYTIGATGTSVIITTDITLGQRSNLYKNYMVQDRTGVNWIADSNGLVWSDKVKTSGGTNILATNSWTYTGNLLKAGSSTGGGNGLVIYETPANSSQDAWLFLFEDSQIDYLKIVSSGVGIAAGTLSWVNGWKTGLTTGTLYGTSLGHLSHEAIVSPLAGQGIIFCDGYTMGAFFQNNVNTAFDPQTASTYTFFGGATGANAGFDILPASDIAQCVSYVGGFAYIGGHKNVVYPWDLKSNSPSSPLIFLPESNTTNIVTVEQNIYIFTGNRGRIYISNGSQVQLFKKIPDHISGTLQPTFQWGAAGSLNNQLFFGIFQSTNQQINASNNYGSVWGIDLESNALYASSLPTANINSVSKPSYLAGFLPQAASNVLTQVFTGNGYYSAWYNSATSSTIDNSTATPYSGSITPYVVSELIPIGTLLHPATGTQIEVKFSMPLVAGEIVTISVGSSFSDYVNNTFTTLGTLTAVGGELSVNFPFKIQNQQWLIVSVGLLGVASVPSFNRLTQIRVIGMTSKDNVPTAPFGIQ